MGYDGQIQAHSRGYPRILQLMTFIVARCAERADSSDGGRSSEAPYLFPFGIRGILRLSGNRRLGDPPIPRLSSLVASRAVPTSFHLCKVQLKSCFFLRVFCIVSTHAVQ